ncbi:MAG: NAD(P)H-dependent oxidoreductase subunit E [Bacillota bacterium]
MNLSEVLDKFPKRQDYLIEILLTYQKTKQSHHFTENELKDIAAHLDIPESQVCSVVSFYSFFSTVPRGKYIIQICHDIPCHLNDDFNVLDTLKDLLGIALGETTNDALFTLEHTSCLGQCDKSPAIRINDKVYGNLTRNKLKAIIAEYKEDTNA